MNDFNARWKRQERAIFIESTLLALGLVALIIAAAVLGI